MFRCELCDAFLPMLQFSHLCPTCYKIRTIIKCYSAGDVLGELEDKFIVGKDKENLLIEDDKKFYKDEKRRLEIEFNKEINNLNKSYEGKMKKEDTDDEGSDYENEKPKLK